MVNGTSYPRSALMTESLLKKLVAQAVRKVQLGGEYTDRDLADLIGCDKGTVENARNGSTKLQPHTLFNLLTQDPMAIEGLLHHYGRRSVPIEAKCDTDALVSTSAAVHSIARAQAESSPGKKAITDHECLEIEGDIDAALEALSALKSRCLMIRKGRAA